VSITDEHDDEVTAAASWDAGDLGCGELVLEHVSCRRKVDEQEVGVLFRGEPDEIVAMDNLPAHKIAAVKAAIEAKGAQFFLLPQYSPDLNPIEMAFSKLKTLLRQAPERTRDGLWQRIGELLDRFTPTECANYFQAAGYGESL